MYVRKELVCGIGCRYRIKERIELFCQLSRYQHCINYYYTLSQDFLDKHFAYVTCLWAGRPWFFLLFPLDLGVLALWWTFPGGFFSVYKMCIVYCETCVSANWFFVPKLVLLLLIYNNISIMKIINYKVIIIILVIITHMSTNITRVYL